MPLWSVRTLAPVPAGPEPLPRVVPGGIFGRPWSGRGHSGRTVVRMIMAIVRIYVRTQGSVHGKFQTSLKIIQCRKNILSERLVLARQRSKQTFSGFWRTNFAKYHRYENTLHPGFDSYPPHPPPHHLTGWYNRWRSVDPAYWSMLVILRCPIVKKSLKTLNYSVVFRGSAKGSQRTEF